MLMYKNKLLWRSMSHHDIYNSATWSSTSVLNHHLQYDLKTNVCDEQVCSMKTSSTALTPKHSSPHCVAEWGVSGFNGRANRFENLNCRRGPPDPVHVSIAPIPSAFGETGQRDGVQGSAYCSVSLRRRLRSSRRSGFNITFLLESF